MSRLPVPGQDDGAWGGILNDFLTQSLNADGTLKSAALTAAGGLTEAVADERYVPADDVGAHNGVASLDSGGNVPNGQLGNVPGVSAYSQFITEDVIIPTGHITRIASQTLEPGTYIASFIMNGNIEVGAILPHANPYVPGDAVISSYYENGNITPPASGAVLVVTAETQYDLVGTNFIGFDQTIFANATDGGGNVFPNATGMTFLKIA